MKPVIFFEGCQILLVTVVFLLLHGPFIILVTLRGMAIFLFIAAISAPLATHIFIISNLTLQFHLKDRQHPWINWLIGIAISGLYASFPL